MEARSNREFRQITDSAGHAPHGTGATQGVKPIPDDDPTGYATYDKVAIDAAGNVAFAFMGLGIIWLCAKFLPSVAKGLFWIGAVVMAVSLIHFFVNTAFGVIAWTGMRHDRRWKWLWAAKGARFIELILCLIALWLAAMAVGYSLSRI